MGTERQVVCPFVAFDDDRDYRSSVPDHRHRCFAESPAAPRALAHQAAYCLSSAFPTCPTFIDWARREAAPPKDEPIRTLRETPSAPRQAEWSGLAASRPAIPEDAPGPQQRQRRTDWTAPPPWVPDAGAGAGTPADEAADDAPRGGGSMGDAPARDDTEAGAGFGAWSGSALGGLAAPRDPARDAVARPIDAPAEIDRGPGSGPSGPAFLGGRAARPSQAGAAPFVPLDPDVARGMPRAEPARRGALGPAPADPSRRPVPARRSDRDRPVDRAPGLAVDRGPDRAGQDPSAPSWERPRRFEAYPSLKSSGSRLAALPRPVLYGLIILVVGLGLFATPFLLRTLTSGDAGATASPTPGASASPGPSASATITPAPSPSQTVYTVKAGDLLSRIAKKFGVTVDQIVRANPQIKNPDKLAIGDRLVIPPAVAPAITDGTITPAP